MVYMITYDLNEPGQKYEQVIATIKKISSGACCSFWKSSYLIKSSLLASEIVEKMKPHFDGNDRLIVIEVTSNKQGLLAKSEWKTINEMF